MFNRFYHFLLENGFYLEGDNLLLRPLKSEDDRRTLGGALLEFFNKNPDLRLPQEFANLKRIALQLAHGIDD